MKRPIPNISIFLGKLDIRVGSNRKEGFTSDEQKNLEKYYVVFLIDYQIVSEEDYKILIGWL